MNWWRNDNRVVLKGKVLLEFGNRFFYDNATGDLIVCSATLADSDTFKCGRGFNRVKHFIDLTVYGKCLCIGQAEKYSLLKDFVYFGHL